MKIIAVDLGAARTGLAVCDENEILASPAGVINERDMCRLAETVCAAAKKHGAERVVVGLPRNMDGSEGDSAKNARAFAEKIKEVSGLPVFMQDERGTTVTAHGYLNDTNTRGRKRKAIIDAVAATVILQDYLARRKNGNA